MNAQNSSNVDQGNVQSEEYAGGGAVKSTNNCMAETADNCAAESISHGTAPAKIITLIGMPASGKSTIGIMAAKFLGYDFLDSDILIQQRESATLPELIREHGLDGFLDLEADVISDIFPVRNTVIATGGSAVYRERAMDHLKTIGRVIYLQLSCEALQKRLHQLEERGVAIAAGMTFEDLYQERVPLYEKYADFTICEEGLDSYQILKEVEQYVHAEF